MVTWWSFIISPCKPLSHSSIQAIGSEGKSSFQNVSRSTFCNLSRIFGCFFSLLTQWESDNESWRSDMVSASIHEVLKRLNHWWIWCVDGHADRVAFLGRRWGEKFPFICVQVEVIFKNLHSLKEKKAIWCNGKHNTDESLHAGSFRSP